MQFTSAGDFKNNIFYETVREIMFISPTIYPESPRYRWMGIMLISQSHWHRWVGYHPHSLKIIRWVLYHPHYPKVTGAGGFNIILTKSPVLVTWISFTPQSKKVGSISTSTPQNHQHRWVGYFFGLHA